MIAPVRNTPKFEPGQLVHHRRYDYRGVIVEVDETCRAGDGWYQSNMTQPNRRQPWYHVLVDDSSKTTYVAESNLEIDQTGQPVLHPLVPHFFDDFDGACYQRNDESWPGW